MYSIMLNCNQYDPEWDLKTCEVNIYFLVYLVVYEPLKCLILYSLAIFTCINCKCSYIGIYLK